MLLVATLAVVTLSICHQKRIFWLPICHWNLFAPKGAWNVLLKGLFTCHWNSTWFRGALFSRQADRNVVSKLSGGNICWCHVLLDTRMTCFLVVSENGHGGSKSVGVKLFGTKDAETFQWFLVAVKAWNRQLQSVRMTIAGEDTKKQQVVEKQSRWSGLHVFASHMLQAFYWLVSFLKLSITRGDDGVC